MKPMLLSLVAGLIVATQGAAEPISYRDAAKILPKAKGRVSLETFEDRLSEADVAALAKAGLKPKDVFNGIGATLSGYGAGRHSPLCIPSE